MTALSKESKKNFPEELNSPLIYFSASLKFNCSSQGCVIMMSMESPVTVLILFPKRVHRDKRFATFCNME